MNGRLDSELLRTFVAIAEVGSFTQATKVVYRTQSTISMQMKKLEEILGHALFLREARGVKLTPDGTMFLENARRIVKLLDQAEKSFESRRIKGIVKIGIPEEYGSTTLPNVLASFSENFPNVQISVRCEPSENFVQSIDNRDLDLAVVISDPGYERGEILFHDPTVWATSKHHLTHEEEPLPLAVFEKGCQWREWALKAMEQVDRNYRIVYSSASVAGVQAAVTSGLAVAVLGQSTLPKGVRSLTRNEGFPKLPGVNVTLQKSAEKPSEAVECMVLAILNSFQV
ncbi:MAG: LysR family transcriptional regulator [Desulfobacula sp.]|nr:LysR family transcriptional regulator [Desulfobacula sp.]